MSIEHSNMTGKSDDMNPKQDQHDVASLSLTEDDLPENYRIQRQGKESSSGNPMVRVSQDKSVPGSREKEGGGSFWSILLGFVALTVAGAAGYKIVELQQALQNSNALLVSMGKNLREVTGVVSQTGEVFNASDSKVKAELKSINFEIRKLWDISNKRNRSDIAKNEEQLKKYEAKVKSFTGELANTVRQSKQNAATLAKLEKQLSDTNRQVKAVSVEQSVSVATIREELGGVSKKLSTLKGRLDQENSLNEKVDKELRNAREALRSFDSYRQQINRRMLQMETSIRSLQKNLTQKK